MEIPLNLPPERQREFLDYLNSVLRARLEGFSGQAGRFDDGRSFTSVAGQFKTNAGHVDLRWIVHRDATGHLTHLSIEAYDTGDTNWMVAVHEIVTAALTATLAGHKKPFFRRSLFFHIGPNLDGEYWLSGFRLSPVLPDDEIPCAINAERVVAIDQIVCAVDDRHADALALEFASRQSARLSLLMNIGLYRAEQVMRWVLPDNIQPPQGSVRLHAQFFHTNMLISEMPKKGELCRLGGYFDIHSTENNEAGEPQRMPREARKILRGIDQANPAVAEAFDRGARLCQVSNVCGRLFPSLGLAYMVAAVEAISEADQTCDGFSNFMRKYVTPTKELDRMLQYLYRNVRSAHFHAGAFPMGEFSAQRYFDPLMDMDTVNADSLHRRGYKLLREAIVNWMMSMASGTEEKTPPAG